MLSKTNEHVRYPFQRCAMPKNTGYSGSWDRKTTRTDLPDAVQETSFGTDVPPRWPEHRLSGAGRASHQNIGDYFTSMISRIQGLPSALDSRICGIEVSHHDASAFKPSPHQH